MAEAFRLKIDLLVFLTEVVFWSEKLWLIFPFLCSFCTDKAFSVFQIRFFAYPYKKDSILSK